MYLYSTHCPGDLRHPHGIVEGVYDTIGILDAPKVRQAFASSTLKSIKGVVAARTADSAILSSSEALKVRVT